MPKIKNLAALAAAVEAARRYARSNPDKAGKYLDQAAAFLDKQTKGKYHGQIDGVADKVRGAAGLPKTSRTVQGFEANAGYGAHSGYGRTTPPVTPSTTTPVTPPATTTSTTTGTPSPGPSVSPLGGPTSPAADETSSHFPGSKDV